MQMQVRVKYSLMNVCKQTWNLRGLVTVWMKAFQIVNRILRLFTN